MTSMNRVSEIPQISTSGMVLSLSGKQKYIEEYSFSFCKYFDFYHQTYNYSFD